MVWYLLHIANRQYKFIQKLKSHGKTCAAPAGTGRDEMEQGEHSLVHTWDHVRWHWSTNPTDHGSQERLAQQSSSLIHATSAPPPHISAHGSLIWCLSCTWVIGTFVLTVSPEPSLCPISVHSHYRRKHHLGKNIDALTSQRGAMLPGQPIPPGGCPVIPTQQKDILDWMLCCTGAMAHLKSLLSSHTGQPTALTFLSHAFIYR